MANLINFIVNKEKISIDLPPGMVLLDFLRKHEHLTGTKEGCREGDCGACMVLCGELNSRNVHYKPVNSCLLPLGDVNGRHIVTIEGLNQEELTPIQQSIVDMGASQCGFCSPGIVIALTGFFLNTQNINKHKAVNSLDGNLCRCTGYMSIKGAADLLCKKFNLLDNKKDRVKVLVEWGLIPDYFLNIPEELKKIHNQKKTSDKIFSSSVVAAGGTDLFVQKPEELYLAEMRFLDNSDDIKGIRIDQDECYIGAATSVEDIKNSSVIQKILPKINDYLNFMGSTPVRNRATIGGNIVNASPIGDLAILFLALDAKLILNDGKRKRELALKDFFKAYKEIDKKENELIERINFKVPENALFNYEKISKRRHLDIASVNSAILIKTDQERISKVHLSAGGIAPVPFYLIKTVDYLLGKKICNEIIKKAASIAISEISPVSDVRGTADYKSLVLRQLIFAHFIKLFPQELK
ncbi:xanthine dehydrogenase small subunit [Candidatus Magnetomoraceae bacterium gMMP-13]